MTTSFDPAHILFANDAPASASLPKPVAPQNNPSALDAAAAAIFPSETPKAAAPIDKDAGVENKLFPDDKVAFDDKAARSFFSGFALSAFADGDKERAEALNAAGDAIVGNMIEAGTDAGDLSGALDIVRERQGDFAPSEEKIAADYASGMETLQSEYGDSLEASLNAARALLRDIEKVAPGTMASLDGTGAGNDPRLIRIAIKEAKRRGYGGGR